MMTPEDEIFLRRALRLAMNGRGHVEPNPMVGCVLVRDGVVIGEGWHRKVGEAHAEPNALADCKSRGKDPAGATAYVTLEPCCHTNKRTPPCAPRLIEANVKRVVIGCLDPNPDVNGHGIAMLRAAGIAVESCVTEANVFRQLIAPFAVRQEPHWRDRYFTLKWAESADGRVAGRNGARMQITNATSSRLVHQLRARSAAIVVGINTVLTDDPVLNVRGIEGAPQPVRVVLDRDLRIPSHAAMLVSPGRQAGGQVIVLCSKATYRASPRVAELEAMSVEVGQVDDREPTEALELNASFTGFTRHGEFLVEPGPTLARAWLPTADRLWVFRSPNKIGGGPSAPKAAEIPDHYVATGTLDVEGDTLTEYLNARSPAFFAATPSADFVLAKEAMRPDREPPTAG